MDKCPNPWCISRSKPLLVNKGHPDQARQWLVRCECGIVTFRHATPEAADAQWNTRPDTTTIEALQAQVAAKDAEIDGANARIKEAQKAVAEINRFACICIADSAQGINSHWLASEAKVISAHLSAALGQGEG